MVRISGILLDIRKYNMLPSAFGGKEKIPHCCGIWSCRAAGRNERN